MAFSPDPSKMYLGFNNGQVFRTTNRGGDGTAGNWLEITGGKNLGGMVVTMAVDPSLADVLYVATVGPAVWRTPDAGKTWQNITSDLPLIGFTSPMALATKPDGPNVFVGTPSGVYACQNPAAPFWRRLGIGLPFVRVADLQYQPSTDTLVAGTYGRGVFASAVGDISPPSVRIFIPKDECGIGPIEGQTVFVHSVIQPADNLITYTYAWSVAGAQPAQGENGKTQTFKIIVPSPAEKVQITLSVNDDDGFVGTATATFTPLSFQQASVLSFVCQLRHLLKVNLLVDPLVDPLRDLNVHPVTATDLERVLGLAEQITSAARSALLAFRRGEHGVRIGRLPSDVDMKDPLGEGRQSAGDA